MTVCAGWTITGTTVRRRCPSEDTWGKKQTLRRGVSDRHNGHAGRTFVKTTVRHMCPLKNTQKNGERPLEIGSLTTRMVVEEDDGLSQMSLEDTQKKMGSGVLGLLERTLTVCHRSLILRSVTELGVPHASPMNPHQTCSVLDLHLSNPTTQETSNAKAPLCRVVYTIISNICNLGQTESYIKEMNISRRTKLRLINKQKCKINEQKFETHTLEFEKNKMDKYSVTMKTPTSVTSTSLL